MNQTISVFIHLCKRTECSILLFNKSVQTQHAPEYLTVHTPMISYWNKVHFISLFLWKKKSSSMMHFTMKGCPRVV